MCVQRSLEEEEGNQPTEHNEIIFVDKILFLNISSLEKTFKCFFFSKNKEKLLSLIKYLMVQSGLVPKGVLGFGDGNVKPETWMKLVQFDNIC